MAQIALHKPVGWLDYIITIVTRGKYCHCSVILDTGKVIESKPFNGVRELNYIGEGEPKGRVIDIYDVDLTFNQEQELSEFLYKQIGKGYDYWLVLGFVIYNTREKRKKYGKWFCSEIVFAGLEKVSYSLLDRVEPWKITPYQISWSNEITLNKTIVI